MTKKKKKTPPYPKIFSMLHQSKIFCFVLFLGFFFIIIIILIKTLFCMSWSVTKPPLGLLSVNPIFDSFMLVICFISFLSVNIFWNNTKNMPNVVGMQSPR